MVGKCIIWNRRKSLDVIDDTIKAEGLGHRLEIVGEAFAEAGKLATNVMKNPGRALEIGAEIGIQKS